METPSGRREPVEKIFLNTPPRGWVALSIGGCGVLARTLMGRHQEEYLETQRIAMAFASWVLEAVGCSSDQALSTPQILVEAADAVIEDPKDVSLLCTAWRYLPEEVEICSVGSNEVLVFEQESVRKALTSHSVNELLRSWGQGPQPRHRMQVTYALGSRKNEKSCHAEDVRVARIPLLPTTTIVVTEEPLMADALLEHPVPRSELFSFIEAWEYPPGRPAKRKTSVLISLQESINDLS